MTTDTTTAVVPAQGGDDPDQPALAGLERFMGHVQGYLAFWLLMTGHRTGLLAAVLGGSGTTDELAARAGTASRPTREWLSGMTAAGYLSHDGGVFSLVRGQAEVFTGGLLPFDPTVLFTFPDVMARVQVQVEDSIRTGCGVPYAAYQPEFSAAQDAMNAPLYSTFLVQEWVPSVDGLADALHAGARVADIGCGGGRAVCELAAAFPSSCFIGYDVDDAALQLGRERARERGLGNVEFERRDVAALALEDAFDAVLAVDAVHDQAAPDLVVAGVRRALRPDGVFVMVEPTAAGDLDVDAEQPTGVMGFATSLAHCVQVSLAEGGPGLGGMWGAAGVRRLLAEAGFSGVSSHDSPSGYTVFAAHP